MSGAWGLGGGEDKVDYGGRDGIDNERGIW